jgi:hypothetical protein
VARAHTARSAATLQAAHLLSFISALPPVVKTFAGLHVSTTARGGTVKSVLVNGQSPLSNVMQG